MTLQDVGAFENTINEKGLRSLATKMLDDRAMREEFLPVSLFGEAAWDITLILFLETRLPPSAKSLAVRLDLPVTAVVRWIAVLENEGMIEAMPSSPAQERESVCLSGSGRQAVRFYLRATAR